MIDTVWGKELATDKIRSRKQWLWSSLRMGGIEKRAYGTFSKAVFGDIMKKWRQGGDILPS